MSEDVSVEERLDNIITQFVRREFGVSPDQPLDPQVHLFREGIVDSVGILSLVRFLEEKFQISVEPRDLVLENFASIRAMRDLVLTRLKPESAQS